MSKIVRKILILTVTLAGLWAAMLTAYAAEFELTNDNVRIRSEASTNGTVVGTASIRERYSIEGEATDSAGNTWYRVRVSGDTFGYIRGDMGRVIGEIGGGAVGEAEPIHHQEALVATSSVRVRSGPSTSHSEVASIQRGTQLILTGKATDASGNVWYLMETTVGDRDIVGFVREDLITLGDLIEMEGSYGEEDPVNDYSGEDATSGDTPSVSNEHLDFEIRYVQNDVGGFDYMLLDRVRGTQWKVDDFLELINVAETNQRLFEEQSGRQRTIIIILAVVIIILALVLTVLIFKLRDLHEDAEMDLRSFRPNQDGGRGSRGGPVKKSGTRPPDGRTGSANRSPKRTPDNDDPANRKGQGNGRPRRPVDSELKAAERDEREPNTIPEVPKREPEVAAKPVNEKPAETRKPQNFLTDDDEFEFEFLNIDD